MKTAGEWAALGALCVTLSVGWYGLAIVPLHDSIDKQELKLEDVRTDIGDLKISQVTNTVTLAAFKESIDRLNDTLIKLEERIK